MCDCGGMFTQRLSDTELLHNRLNSYTQNILPIINSLREDVQVVTIELDATMNPLKSGNYVQSVLRKTFN